MGLDRAIAYTVLARGWSSAAGLVTVALIAHNLSPAEQGYYYTFGSLVALQLIFELGFSVVILQLASHERALLTVEEHGHITGPERARQRLASVLKKAVKWYAVAAVLMGVLLIAAGWRFFVTNQDAAGVAWRAPWIAVVLATVLTFQIDPVFSFLEGCGFVSTIARARLTQSVLGSGLSWAALTLHHGLFAPAMFIAGQALAGGYFLWTRRTLLRSLLRTRTADHAIDWQEEVWPFQWRIAISFASGYLIFQLFNPALMRFAGPVAAGQMGMSLSLSNAIGAVAIAWISTKSAPFGALIARHEYGTLDATFFRALRQTLVLCAGGALAVWAASYILSMRHQSFSVRLLPPLPFALLLATMCVNQCVSSMAIYLRAHKQEKFLLVSVLSGTCVAASTLTLGRWYGTLGMTGGYFALTVVIGLGLGWWTFSKYRRLWHAPESALLSSENAVL